MPLIAAVLAMSSAVTAPSTLPPTLSAFELALAAQPSATAVLQQWCGQHGIADPARIAATVVRGDDALPPPDLNDTLALPDTAEPAYRHVRLACGDLVLSEAHNWYAASRLTPEMNHLLATTDTPFGKVVAPLGFRREPLGSVRGASHGCPSGTILSQRALLRLPDGQPLALLLECYLPAILGQK